jgi:carboxypeptidase C (cathepsin A)
MVLIYGIKITSYSYLLIRYVGVGENEHVQVFYYFIESENNPKDDPLMLWLTGGPGCSALSGLIFEIGNFNFAFG